MNHRYLGGILAFSLALSAPLGAQDNTRVFGVGSPTQAGQTTPQEPVAAPAAPETTDTANQTAASMSVDQTYRVRVGETIRINSTSTNFFVSNTGVVQAEVRPGQSGIFVTGQRPGTSNIDLVQPDGSRNRLQVRVAGGDPEEDLRSLQQLLQEELPLVNARLVGESIVVSGTVSSADEKRKLDRILERFDIIDMTNVEYANSGDIQRLLDERGLGNVRVNVVENLDGEKVAFLSGVATTDDNLADAQRIAAMFYPEVENQVELQKEMIELNAVLVTVDLNKLNQRGQNLFNQINDLDLEIGVIEEGVTAENGDFQIITSEPAGRGIGWGTNGEGPHGEEAIWRLIPSGNVQAELNAQKTSRYVSFYAEPFITVLNGEQGYFKDGFSTYVALEGEDGAGVVQVDTGIQLTVTPYLRANGKILMDTLLEFSTSSANAPRFTGAGVEQLGVKQSQSRAQVEVNPGETIVIAGNNSNLFETNNDETPLLGKIPILNFFFNASSRQGTNLRSYFFITPQVTPTVYMAEKEPFSRQGQAARPYYERDAQMRKSSVGYWLGFDTAIPPAPPEEVYAYPEDTATGEYWEADSRAEEPADTTTGTE